MLGNISTKGQSYQDVHNLSFKHYITMLIISVSTQDIGTYCMGEQPRPRLVRAFAHTNKRMEVNEDSDQNIDFSFGCLKCNFKHVL